MTFYKGVAIAIATCVVAITSVRAAKVSERVLFKLPAGAILAPIGQAISPDLSSVAHVICAKSCVVYRNGVPGASFEKVHRRNLSFSEDGKKLAYVGVRGSASYLVLDGVESALTGVADMPAFGPNPALPQDGSRVAVTVTRNDKKHVLLGNSDYGPYDAVGPTLFSDQGDHFAFLAKRGDAFFAVRDGVEGPAYQQVSAVQLSSDGQVLSYIARHPEGEAIVTNDMMSRSYSSIANMAMSRDGTRIAFQVMDLEKGTFFVWDGKATPPYPAGQNAPIVFSRDSKRVGFFAMPKDDEVSLVLDGVEGPRFFYVTHLVLPAASFRFAYGARRKTGQPFLVSNTGDTAPYKAINHESILFWQSGGEKLAYLADGGDGRTRLFADGKAVTKQSYMDTSSLVLSRDGRHVTFLGGRSGGRMLLFDGREIKRFDTALEYSLSPTADGAAFLVKSGSSLRVVTVKP